jgi:hypothetical protein
MRQHHRVDLGVRQGRNPYGRLAERVMDGEAGCPNGIASQQRRERDLVDVWALARELCAEQRRRA